jgi:hypothetical protein
MEVFNPPVVPALGWLKLMLLSGLMVLVAQVQLRRRAR